MLSTLRERRNALREARRHVAGAIDQIAALHASANHLPPDVAHAVPALEALWQALAQTLPEDYLNTTPAEQRLADRNQHA